MIVFLAVQIFQISSHKYGSVDLLQGFDVLPDAILILEDRFDALVQPTPARLKLDDRHNLVLNLLCDLMNRIRSLNLITMRAGHRRDSFRHLDSSKKIYPEVQNRDSKRTLKLPSTSNTGSRFPSWRLLWSKRDLRDWDTTANKKSKTKMNSNLIGISHRSADKTMLCLILGSDYITKQCIGRSL